MIELKENQEEIVAIEGRGVDIRGLYSGYARLVAEIGDKVIYRFQCEFVPGYDFADVNIDKVIAPVYRLFPIDSDKRLEVAQRTLYGCLNRYVYSMVGVYAFNTKRRSRFLGHFGMLQDWGYGNVHCDVEDLDDSLIDIDDEGYSAFDPEETIKEEADIETEDEWKNLFRNAFMRQKNMDFASEMWAEMFLK